jgi:hypothetical protein
MGAVNIFIEMAHPMVVVIGLDPGGDLVDEEGFAGGVETGSHSVGSGRWGEDGGFGSRIICCGGSIGI